MKIITIEQSPSGFALQCDAKPLRTPLGAALILPNAQLAEAIAKEWRAQGDKLRKETMPLTQIACIALDLVTHKKEALLEDILSYSETDLLCYRAGDIPQLLETQAQELDGIIQWAAEKLSIHMHITQDIMPIAQPTENKQKLFDILEAYDIWHLAALASVVKPLPSIILAIALIEGHINAQRAFTLSHLEETYETGKWGEDEEKEQKMEKLKQEIIATGEYLQLL